MGQLFPSLRGIVVPSSSRVKGSLKKGCGAATLILDVRGNTNPATQRPNPDDANYQPTQCYQSVATQSLSLRSTVCNPTDLAQIRASQVLHKCVKNKRKSRAVRAAKS